MSDLNETLGDLIREIVRDELRAALANQNNNYMTTAEAADFARVTPQTIRRWISEGRLVGMRAGREVRVVRRDLERTMLGAASEIEEGARIAAERIAGK